MSEGEVTTSFHVKITSYGSPDRVMKEKTLRMCRTLYDAFGDMATVFLSIGGSLRKIEFDPLGSEGGTITNNPFGPPGASP